MPTLTVFPAADAAVTREFVDESFSDIRVAGGNAVYQGEGGGILLDMYLQASSVFDQFQQLRRLILTFDTSALGATSVVTAAVLTLKGYGKQNGLGETSVEICSASPASNTSIVAADYDDIARTSFASKAYTSVAVSVSSGVALNNFTLDSNGIANISKTSYSRFSVQFEWDRANSFTGAWDDSLSTMFSFADSGASGTVDDPTLVITYELGQPIIKRHGGIPHLAGSLRQRNF